MRYRKLIAVIVFISMAHMALAAFAGSADDRNKDKYSLKNLNKLSKNYSLSSLRTSTFQFKGFYQVEPNSGNPANSYLSLQRGNITYVYPYKYKVKVPRFATPTPPQR
ncbi:hypothetical protein FC093_16025 [Ilyomonas limi]|uniref:Uncharacterized protein n=1 Tax=Ilyomonas limi TaxID=2575867 RepID=A0A4U3KYY0_9BACT|nr:hypothetical protein [Ilyomonas limi]TKK67004.1 hypothetical protein FC093_16025 [Ilyomonas limi]